MGTRRRWVFRALRWLGLGLLAAVAVMLAFAWTSLGRKASGARRERMEHSAQWKAGGFENPQPLRNDFGKSVTAVFSPSPDVSPRTPVQTSAVDSTRLATPPPSGLRVTWFGHSSTLVEVDGKRFLTDPIWSERTSPISWVGPERYVQPLVRLDQLPPIDAVLISHDHYDHLDRRSIEAMKGWPTRFVVPLGVGAHLAYWGVPESQIVEVDWWERVKLGDVEVVCTPARHASGRALLDYDANLWAGYALLGPAHRVYYSGDTGLFPAMKRIGAELGPFDLTMIEVGQYNPAWPDWHIGPEQAVTAHQWVRGRVFLPVHWGLFSLADHGWTEPVERALAAAQAAQVSILTPRMGQSVEPASPPPPERWWPRLPWRTGAEDPIVSTQL
jgi:L-ascorbate metabolism protein UlaG (beta-lactamase superfamily)